MLQASSSEPSMRAVVQRVTSARVTVGERVTGEIGRGLLVLLGVEQDDGPADVQLHRRARSATCGSSKTTRAR